AFCPLFDRPDIIEENMGGCFGITTRAIIGGILRIGNLENIHSAFHIEKKRSLARAEDVSCAGFLNRFGPALRSGGFVQGIALLLTSRYGTHHRGWKIIE